MNKQSAGILAYRVSDSGLQVLLVHPGGPFFARKDNGAWSIPKGEFTDGEEPLAAAMREFNEELGIAITGDFVALKPVKLKSGKTVHAWAVYADMDIAGFRSNTFTIEWPAKSGKMKTFPEVDKAEWFTMDIAKEKLNAAQADFIDELIALETK